MLLNTEFDPRLLSRIEDAGINASAPPQQRWIDGWLVRFSPGKAHRARCIQAVASGVLPLVERLALCQQLFDQAGLPLLARLTPFSQPAGLDQALAERGWALHDDTRVMACALDDLAELPLAEGLHLRPLAPAEFAAVVGALRGSPDEQCQAHAERLLHSPVPYQGWALCEDQGAQAVLCCGQVATEADLVGVYDVHTADAARGRGLARQLCAAMLHWARQEQGVRTAYLQVGADNHAARTAYRKLGFSDAYGYHYRLAPGASATSRH